MFNLFDLFIDLVDRLFFLNLIYLLIYWLSEPKKTENQADSVLAVKNGIRAAKLVYLIFQSWKHMSQNFQKSSRITFLYETPALLSMV